MANPAPARMALVERMLLTLRGLFSEKPKGAERIQERMAFNPYDGRRLEISLAAPLGSFHLLLLEALIAEAQSGPLPASSDCGLREALRLTGKAAAGSSLSVDLSYYRLAVCLGRVSSAALRKQIDEALRALQGTRFSRLDGKGGIIAAYNLISFRRCAPDAQRGRLRVSLCPALSEAAKNGRKYTRVNMDEARLLKRCSSVLLHGWLSSIIAPGRTFPINIKTILDGVIWAPAVKKGSATYRARRAALLNRLLPDLENAGWAWVHDRGKDQVRIARPPIADKAAERAARLASGLFPL